MADAIDLNLQKSVCKEIGFKEGTEKFRECVIELHKRKKANLNQATKKIEEEKKKNERISTEKRIQEKIAELQEKLVELETKKLELLERSEAREQAMRQSRALQAIVNSLSGFTTNTSPSSHQYEIMCWHDCLDEGWDDFICQTRCFK